MMGPERINPKGSGREEREQSKQASDHHHHVFRQSHTSNQASKQSELGFARMVGRSFSRRRLLFGGGGNTDNICPPSLAWYTIAGCGSPFPSFSGFWMVMVVVEEEEGVACSSYTLRRASYCYGRVPPSLPPSFSHHPCSFVNVSLPASSSLCMYNEQSVPACFPPL